MNYIHTNWFNPPRKHLFSKEEKEIVIGDIHGQYDSLTSLLLGIGDSCETKEFNLTFLGDLIDRGPRNFDCLKLATEVKKDYKSVTRLLGNHELMMFYSILDLLSQRERIDYYDLWTMNGGVTVVDEILEFVEKTNSGKGYGLNSGTLLYGFKEILGEEAWKDLYESFLPFGNRQHKGTHKRVGNILFTHAGVDPRCEDIEQYFSEDGNQYRPNHWAWIRDDFLRFGGKFPEDVFVIHGHTPTYEFLNKFVDSFKSGKIDWPHQNRICLDAGSFKTSVVLALEIEKGMFRFHFSWNEKIINLDVDNNRKNV